MITAQSLALQTLDGWRDVDDDQSAGWQDVDSPAG